LLVLRPSSNVAVTSTDTTIWHLKLLAAISFTSNYFGKVYKQINLLVVPKINPRFTIPEEWYSMYMYSWLELTCRLSTGNEKRTRERLFCYHIIHVIALLNLYGSHTQATQAQHVVHSVTRCRHVPSCDNATASFGNRLTLSIFKFQNFFHWTDRLRDRLTDRWTKPIA